MAINISCHENLQTYWNSLQKMLKSVRMACGLTQDDIAAALNINRVTYTNYERGNSSPDILTVILLSQLYKIPPDSFFHPDDFIDLSKPLPREKLWAGLYRTCKLPF